MSFILTTDSSSDLSLQICKEKNIIPLMMTYTVNGEEIKDTMEETDIIAFYNKMRAGKETKTSQINAMEYVDFWTPLLSEGKPILHIALGSAISGTYENGVRAKNMILETNPDAEIYIVDSISASLGLGMLSILASDMRTEGKTAKECAQWLEENKHKAHAYYTTADLTYLHRGGRVSKTSKNVAHLLGIQPILNLAPDGKLQVFEKVRGDKATLKRFCEIAKNLAVDAQNQTLYISHADNIEKARLYGERLKEELGFKDVCYTYIGSTIGSHTGPALISVFFLGTERK